MLLLEKNPSTIGDMEVQFVFITRHFHTTVCAIVLKHFLHSYLLHLINIVAIVAFHILYV